MDTQALAQAIRDCRGGDIQSVVIVRNGCLVAEAYEEGISPDTPQDMRSIAKSVTSALTGIALGEGKLPGVRMKLLEYFPGLALDPMRSEIRLEHLLYMTSGLAWNNTNEESSRNMMYSENWVQAILRHPGAYRPGERFNYSNGDAHLVSALLHKATGQSMLDYARSRLFEPLGIANLSWDEDPQGITIGAWALALTARDMAKLGLLYLMKGEWDGQTILPRAWVRESLKKRVVLNISRQAYGYYWWSKPLTEGLVPFRRKMDYFYAAGSGGNRIFVVPDLQLIVAMTAKSASIERPEAILNGIVRTIQSEQALPRRSDLEAILAQAIQEFRAGGR